MYSFSAPVEQVKGIGPVLSKKLAQQHILTIKDLLLQLPLHYLDHSHQTTITQLQPGQTATIKAKVNTCSQYYKNRRLITRAKISDQTGQLNCIWFNNRFIKNKLKKNQTYYFAGQLNKYQTLTQPTVEAITGENLHTGRLVPVYTSTLGLKQGKLRRILKEIIDQLPKTSQSIFTNRPSLTQALKQLHFPDDSQQVVAARERLALAELLSLMHHAQQLKKHWQQHHQAPTITLHQPQIPTTIPFTLTQAQHQATKEILADLHSNIPMNRILVGDVGSGKTVVAGLAANQVIYNQFSACLIAPTQILAKQHYQTLTKLFPKLNCELIIAKNATKSDPNQNHNINYQNPSLWIGTHAVLNHLDQIQPGLIIYDEQHRFGVAQRSQPAQQAAHLLTMTATPIPRSLMLTIFSHLSLSVLDELPPGRLPAKTWLVPASKRQSAYAWLNDQLRDPQALGLIICPFIDPSHYQALENVAAAKDLYQQTQKIFKKLKVGLLHSRLSANKKHQLMKKLFANQLDLLISTPMVEVGLDLPQAKIVVIEAAERFGLASLHQLRGRVGRAGQQGYCLLFTTDHPQQSGLSQQVNQRLQNFTQETNGQKLAELDLKNRGAGNLFGVEQHGFQQLRFAAWTNLELIAQARKTFKKIQQQQLNWQPFLKIAVSKQQVSGN
ncbi:MAG: DEAD/DEAH box helicase [Candidatus Pacebacteria bacterium]|nr:DEAD/DEAH box helicase [Candidatus Paceibacterota bacterium]